MWKPTNQTGLWATQNCMAWALLKPLHVVLLQETLASTDPSITEKRRYCSIMTSGRANGGRPFNYEASNFNLNIRRPNFTHVIYLTSKNVTQLNVMSLHQPAVFWSVMEILRGGGQSSHIFWNHHPDFDERQNSFKFSSAVSNSQFFKFVWTWWNMILGVLSVHQTSILIWYCNDKGHTISSSS